MDEMDGGGDLIDVLPAGALGGGDVDVDVGLVEVELDGDYVARFTRLASCLRVLASRPRSLGEPDVV
ncbi:MAG: hypothetical protein AAGL49_10690, partial [Pseudomonadota bacterium]